MGSNQIRDIMLHMEFERNYYFRYSHVNALIKIEVFLFPIMKN